MSNSRRIVYAILAVAIYIASALTHDFDIALTEGRALWTADMHCERITP